MTDGALARFRKRLATAAGALVVCLIAVLLALGVEALMAWTASKALRASSMHRADAWISHLQHEMPGLPEIVAAASAAADEADAREVARVRAMPPGEAPWPAAPVAPPETLPQEMAALLQEEGLQGDFVRIDLHDAAGRGFFSARLAQEGDEAAQGAGLAQTHPDAWAALTRGERWAEIAGGVVTPWSARLADAFLPLRDEKGRIFAHARVRLIVAAAAMELTQGLLMVGLGVAALTALAFLAPALGWLALRGKARAAHERARRAALNDILTGLANRAGFEEEAAVLVRQAHERGEIAVVISLDIDRFRMINDLHGITVGDALLRHAARVLRGSLRKEDVIGRLGSDEFAAVAAMPDDEAIPALLERIRSRLAAPGMIEGRLLAAACTIGACRLEPGRMSVASCLRRAEIARTEARDEGAGGCRIFEADMEQRLTRRRDVERAIREGMEHGRFSLAYQPLVSLRHGRMRGFEALMRLTDSEGRPISPGEFIPVAEETGAIGELGAWSLREATAAAASWPEPLEVSVNLSALQFGDGRLAGAVREALERSGLPPHRLELEITESLLISDPDQAERQMRELQALGVSVALDDFGTGYSSLAYLWRFRFDRLKLDRSFVQALELDAERARDMIAGIVALGKRLGMEVTAEGIETEAQAEAARTLGCDDLQGFHFGRPMPEPELRDLMLWRLDGAAEQASASSEAAAVAPQRAGGGERDAVSASEPMRSRTA